MAPLALNSRLPHQQNQPRTLAFTTLDVFTSTPYRGNPLALIRIPASLRHLITKPQKQSIAAEFNLSETIFVHEQSDAGDAEWDVEIFTSDAELPFAGHPTIGAASYMLNSTAPSKGGIGTGKGKVKGKGRGRLVTKAGAVEISLVDSSIPASIHINGHGTGPGRVQAEIPHNVHIHVHTIGDLEPPIPGLSLHPAIRHAELGAPIVSIVKGMTFLLVRLETLEMLAGVGFVAEDVSFHGLLDREWGMGFVAKYYFVVLSSQFQNPGYPKELTGPPTRIRSRMLESAMEDPATGSAASALSCYLALQNGARGRNVFEVTQGVEMGRESSIGVEVLLGEGEGVKKRVEVVRLSGDAVVVMEGSLRI